VAGHGVAQAQCASSLYCVGSTTGTPRTLLQPRARVAAPPSCVRLLKVPRLLPRPLHVGRPPLRRCAVNTTSLHPPPPRESEGLELPTSLLATLASVKKKLMTRMNPIFTDLSMDSDEFDKNRPDCKMQTRRNFGAQIC
jgi:hypothetical protein